MLCNTCSIFACIFAFSLCPNDHEAQALLTATEAHRNILVTFDWIEFVKFESSEGCQKLKLTKNTLNFNNRTK